MAKQYQEELYDKKSRDAQKHADKLRLDRERLKERIAGTQDSRESLRM